ncbi:HAD family hydrolase [Sphingobacterium kitahiroshimense]|uniref:phosphoglycolate phosphatase n=1 Tax=Sphingobacterium kitahiroshimense TaxID=470446 RepID=A0ABV0BUI9_9SPHI
MKLIIFDLDGTLLDTLQDLGDSCNMILERYGYPTHLLESYKKFVGNGVRMLIERALPQDVRTDDIITHLLSAFKKYYEEKAESHTKPYAGIIQLLQDLQSSGYLISIASNKYHEAVLPLVAKYFSEFSFDLILGHRNGHPAKPDPDIVFDTLNILNVKPDDCFYVGDSSVDMDTANNAGVQAIGVSWGFREVDELRLHGATFIIDEPKQLLDILTSSSISLQ